MTLISSRRIYTGRIVSLDVDTVQYPNGNIGDLEMLRHPGASAVLPLLDPRSDADPRVLLIKQFRHATGGDIWEIPAGRRDGTESHETTAHRELREETGYKCETLTHLTSILTTPGFTDEVIHLYLAEGLTPGASAQEADEVMVSHEIRWSEVLRMVKEREITDTKSLNAILYAKAFLSLGQQG